MSEAVAKERPRVPIVFHLLFKKMNQSNPLLEPAKRIAYVEALWHHDIVEQARLGFNAEMQEAGIDHSLIDVIQVPGSLEIPLQCKLLAATQRYQLIVAAGLIVDGDIYRHDFVASTVLDAMMRVQLDAEIPIMSVVLTPHLFSQASEHHDFFFAHFLNKGKEAARSSIQVLENLCALREPRLSQVS